MASIALPWCLGMAAPFYNLGLVIIVVLLFVKLLKIQTQLYKKPWKLLFAAVLVFVVEELLTILAALNFISFPHFIVGFFEMIIILLFIYMLLLQRDYIKKSV